MVRRSHNWPLDSADHVLCFYFVMFGCNLPIKHDTLKKYTLGHSGGHSERKGEEMVVEEILLFI